MRKSTLFVSAMLTVFMLALVFGVVSAYQGTATASETRSPGVAQGVLDAQPAARWISLAPTQSGVVTPDQATALAMQMTGLTDVYSVESTTYEGAAAYLVTFSSGDLVYVSPAGQVLAVTKVQPVVVTEQRNNNQRHNQNSGNSGGGGDDDHHDDDDHDEDDEHDD